MLVTADQNGTIVVTEGPPKMRMCRRICLGSEVTAMDVICNPNWKLHLRVRRR